MFKNGQGVAQNDAEAVRWLRKAADQGHTIAQRNLAIMLEAGRGM
jgi:TPR repeat protein